MERFKLPLPTAEYDGLVLSVLSVQDFVGAKYRVQATHFSGHPIPRAAVVIYLDRGFRDISPRYAPNPQLPYYEARKALKAVPTEVFKDLIERQDIWRAEQRAYARKLNLSRAVGALRAAQAAVREKEAALAQIEEEFGCDADLGAGPECDCDCGWTGDSVDLVWVSTVCPETGVRLRYLVSDKDVRKEMK